LASVLEVGDNMERFFNIFDAAPENDIHRSEQQAQQSRDSQPVIDYFL
jgi:serine/threonine-protein phosphatase PPG1